MASIPILNIDEEIRKRVEKMIEFKKLNIICPNCGSPNYMMDISSVSKEYKIKCTNCMKYYKDYDEVIKKHAEKLNRKYPDGQSIVLSSRKVFETDELQSAKADAGKPQLSLVPRRIIFDIAKIREYGNDKYPEGGVDNWKQVEPERYRDAAFRHFLAYLDDPYGVDAESGLPHLHHLATNIAFLCELEDPKINYISEIPRKGPVLAKKVKENDDGSVTFSVTKEGQDVFDKLHEKTMQAYKDLSVEHMEAEPGWTNWMKAYRDTDDEAEYYRIGLLTNKRQYGDFDFESGEIIPRKEK